jgi:hypothetical protein
MNVSPLIVMSGFIQIGQNVFSPSTRFRASSASRTHSVTKRSTILGRAPPSGFVRVAMFRTASA